MPHHDPHITQELLSHQTFLRRLAIDLVGSDGDDLVQDVWRRALERPPGDRRQLRGWLTRVARNLAANRWRDEARRAEREERKAREQPATDELEARFEVRKELVGALDALSRPCREAILLRYFEGLAPREIARRQETPVATVKTRLRRGLVQLREALDKRSGGDRTSWMSAVTALTVPVDGGVGTSASAIGGMAMGTMMKVSGAALVTAACVYFAVRTPGTEPPRVAGVQQPAADVELAEPPARVASDDPAAGTAQRSPVAEELVAAAPLGTEANVLRVILEGVGEEHAAMATVTLTGVDEAGEWPAELRGSWPSQGLTSEFDLNPFLASVERHGGLRAMELEVGVDHPALFAVTTRVLLSGGVNSESGETVHEVRVSLVQPEFWPALTLAVRDAHTRAHLDDVELRFAPGVGASFWGRNVARALLDEGLSSPISLMGGRDPNEPSPKVAGLALSPAPGESPRLVELARRFGPERGVIVSARAPGYAWGSTSIDVSKGERELLLKPAAELGVRLANVQLERYAALGTDPMLCVYWVREDGGNQYVHFEPLGETLENEGLRLESLVPGRYRVTVELGGGLWSERPTLAREELSLAAGETRELVLALEDPPAPPERATLGGTISFPAPSATWGEENARLQLYFQPNQRWRNPDVELPLAELRRASGPLPTWAFRVEDLPVGRYRVQLLPLLKVWMVDLSPGDAGELELVLSELAEVLVETVDERSGDRLPVPELYFRNQQMLPGQRQNDFTQAETEEPGRFRFWAAPGTVMVWPKFPTGADRDPGNGREFELVAGLQSVRLELASSYAMRFEFREDGVALPVGDPGMRVMENIRAVDHGGRVTRDGLQSNMRVEVSAPGLYEISFDALDADHYHPIPPRLVDVRAGEPVEVIVELKRK